MKQITILTHNAQVNLCLFEKSVVMQISYMTELFRSKDESYYREYLAIKEWGGVFSIRSTSTPAIVGNNEVHLWGYDRNADNILLIKEFDSNADRNLWVGDLHKALEEWSGYMDRRYARRNNG